MTTILGEPPASDQLIIMAAQRVADADIIYLPCGFFLSFFLA